MTAEMAVGRRRVFVEDARRNGQFLRVTWHGERRQFVVSNWEDTLCVGATRVSVDEAPELIGVLAGGLADAVTVAASRRGPQSLSEHLRVWWRERGRRALVVPIHDLRDRARRSA